MAADEKLAEKREQERDEKLAEKLQEIYARGAARSKQITTQSHPSADIPEPDVEAQALPEKGPGVQHQQQQPKRPIQKKMRRKRRRGGATKQGATNRGGDSTLAAAAWNDEAYAAKQRQAKQAK